MDRFELQTETIIVLRMFRGIYSYANEKHPESDGAKIYKACNDAFYNNNEPVNILKVCMILDSSKQLVELGNMLPETYKVLLSDMSKISGYSESELTERVAYPEVA